MSWLNCFGCNKKAFDVKELDFNRMGLTDVPPEVFNFERTLEILHLDGNKITELPRTLFQCEELKYLNIGDNEISTLPPLISKLVNLNTLVLSRNYLLYKDISSNISQCNRLTVLDLSSNNLEKLPEGLTSLVNLQQLFLNDTLIDFLPANFGRLGNLHILELRDNVLSSLPKSLRRLNSLTRLDISNNDFCDLPDVIGSMMNLTELWVNGNGITTIHPSVGNLRKLKDFDASKNEIEIIPKEIGHWTKLTTLILSNNNISTVPQVVGNLRCLQTLKLDNNFLNELPTTIGKLSNLEELDLQHNRLHNIPNSIGFLRNLSFLVLSHNVISNLPQELGSCVSLSVLNIHHNCLKKLPDEIGHLQKLTCLGLIGNRLHYLPITVAKLPLLRALWLTENQSHPLIPLQTEMCANTNQLVLTCFLLPQIKVSRSQSKPEDLSRLQMPSPNRRICFKESSGLSETTTRLTRAPTPYPKDLQRYQRSLNNALRKNRESNTQSVNVDMNVLQIKEAKVTPMKGSTEQTNDKLVDTTENSYVTDESGNSNITSQIHNNNLVDMSSNKCFNTENRISPNINYKNNLNSVDDYLTDNLEGLGMNWVKQPPPYHIAAMYSKNAHIFSNVIKEEQSSDTEIDKVTSVDKPRNFIQDQPTDILMPQPQHPHDHSLNFEPRQSSPLLQLQKDCNETADEEDKDVVQSPSLHVKKESGWLFGNHTNPKILNVTLTPCCYVLGFTVKTNENGVFVDKVHKDGNAYDKLLPGDKILSLDDFDLTKMNPVLAAKIVLIRGPETESILISRN